jgi:Transposase IS4
MVWRLGQSGQRTGHYGKKDVLAPVGGAVPRRTWSMRTLSGESIVEGGDSGSFDSTRRHYDYFMAVFPIDQLMRMVRLTNEKLNLKKRPCTTTAELLQFIGLHILGTRYEFGSRAELWKQRRPTAFLFRPHLGGRPACRAADLTTYGAASRSVDRQIEQRTSALRSTVGSW